MIESDRMLTLSELQDQYQPHIPRLGVSSEHYARIVHDVVHLSQYFQDLCALCPWDQWAKRILCLLLEF